MTIEVFLLHNKYTFAIFLFVLTSVGGLGLNDEPLICGGKNRSTDLLECFTYVNNDWVVHSELNLQRHQAAMSKLPDSKGLFITGGKLTSGTQTRTTL